MAIDLQAARAVLSSVKAAGSPIAAQLDDARHITRDVMIASRRGLDEMPVRRELATRLDQAFELQANAATAIDDAFGSGTWMAKASRASASYVSDAHLALGNPALGANEAQRAVTLLTRNARAYDDAITALRSGDVERLTDTGMLREIDFGASTGWMLR